MDLFNSLIKRTEEVISDNIPLQRNGENITTQFEAVTIEALGFLKMK